jgi:predicted metal-dependent HD superfamily phosphohydrolase
MDKYITLKEQVLELLRTKLPESLYYHGADHTLKVMDVAEEYIQHHKLGVHEAQILRLAVLLHDVGYTKSSLNHEEEGAKIAKEMMTELGYSFLQTKVVADLIRATKMPHRPTNQLERIICDVDLDYLGRENYKDVSELLFKELYENSMIDSREEWIKMQVEFLENHKFHTLYARNERQPVKEKWLAELRSSLPLGESLAS